MIRQWWRLLRGGNALLAGSAGLVGFYLARGDWWPPEALPAFFAPALITAYGNIDNDICDLELDHHIKPDRPLPSGAVTLTAARILAAVMLILGMLAGGFAGTIPFTVCLVVVVLLMAYNRFLAGMPMVGNIVIAFLGGLPILFGAVCVPVTTQGAAGVALLATVIAFWLHWAREILKDALDIEGDRALGRRTLPVVFSQRTAIRWAAFPMIPAAGFALYLGLTHWLGVLYMFGICLTVVPALALGAAQCAVNPSAEVASRWSFGLKLIMIAGLVWMVLGTATL
ncbi:MAG TPA: geranylgeranylglycerol-phosphate geranylgeranyltransferase [candidate division Zixibacteria bacterium]|nr:geranylgeranylglycerol-phosphate geranylgeranyltransferase [candidate division Zixibacteria bacterium]